MTIMKDEVSEGPATMTRNMCNAKAVHLASSSFCNANCPLPATWRASCRKKRRDALREIWQACLWTRLQYSSAHGGSGSQTYLSPPFQVYYAPRCPLQRACAEWCRMFVASYGSLCVIFISGVKIKDRPVWNCPRVTLREVISVLPLHSLNEGSLKEQGWSQNNYSTKRYLEHLSQLPHNFIHRWCSPLQFSFHTQVFKSTS